MACEKPKPPFWTIGKEQQHETVTSWCCLQWPSLFTDQFSSWSLFVTPSSTQPEELAWQWRYNPIYFGDRDSFTVLKAGDRKNFLSLSSPDWYGDRDKQLSSHLRRMVLTLSGRNLAQGCIHTCTCITVTISKLNSLILLTAKPQEKPEQQTRALGEQQAWTKDLATKKKWWCVKGQMQVHLCTLITRLSHLSCPLCLPGHPYELRSCTICRCGLFSQGQGKAEQRPSTAVQARYGGSDGTPWIPEEAQRHCKCVK